MAKIASGRHRRGIARDTVDTVRASRDGHEYHEAWAARIRTVSVDEMTGIQALERAAPALALKPGLVERREYEYIRHGTQTLIAGFDVATGQVCGIIGARRTEDDFARFLDRLIGGRTGQAYGSACRQPGGAWRVSD